MGVPDHSVTACDFFYPLPVQLDIERLRGELEKLMERVPPAFARTRQLGLHSFPGSTDPWYDGCRKQREIGKDEDYTLLHPELKGTYIGHIFEEALPFQAFRARVMILEPKTCYSVHRDDTPRYHIAVNTTHHARFVFVDQQHVVHVPADGRVYFVDTRETHTAFNGADSMRIHIVFGGPLMKRREGGADAEV